MKLLRATYANVAATAALVISMSGTAYAATVIYSSNIADNTIRSVDVHDDNLQSRDILNGSLTGADVKDGSLGLTDLSATAKDGLKGEPGEPGTPGTNGTNGTNGVDGQDGQDGAPGTPGTNGTNGTNGVSGWDVFKQEYAGSVSDFNKEVVMYCPAGKKPLSGGYEMSTGSRVVTVDQNHYYNLGGEGWIVSARLTNLNGNATADYRFFGWLICATVQ